MLSNGENNGKAEFGLVTPTPVLMVDDRDTALFWSWKLEV